MFTALGIAAGFSTPFCMILKDIKSFFQTDQAAAASGVSVTTNTKLTLTLRVCALSLLFPDKKCGKIQIDTAKKSKSVENSNSPNPVASITISYILCALVRPSLSRFTRVTTRDSLKPLL